MRTPILTLTVSAAGEVWSGTLDGRRVWWRTCANRPEVWAELSARQALNLQHPNLHATEQVFVTKSGISCLQEYMDFGSLTDVLERYEDVKMTEPHIAYVLKQVRHDRVSCVVSVFVT